MPLDHYVPQVHLRKFYSPSLGDRLRAIRKSDLHLFTPGAKAVCAITDGSANAYLRENRAVEEFLKIVEPRYNSSVEKLVAGKVDDACVFTIAGFVAYVILCSPTAMRLHSEHLKGVLEVTHGMLEARGDFPPPPPELGGKTLVELLESGRAHIEVDPKFPQAIGVTSILKLVASLGNFKWEILQNGFDDSPYFTCDFPAAIEATDDPRVLNRIVPLAPTLAIRIRPDLAIQGAKPDYSFSSFKFQEREIGRDELIRVNQAIVRCAEDVVFYRDDRPWIRQFISKNRHYRIEPRTHKLPTPTGTLLVATQKVALSTAAVG